MSENERDYILYLEDILNAINKIESYTKDLSFEDFSGNSMVIDAVIRNFEVIGEATNNIPPEIKGKYPDVEWKEATGFRNVLIHDYFGIDLESVWDTVMNNVPSFKGHIEKVLLAEHLTEKGENNRNNN